MGGSLIGEATLPSLLDSLGELARSRGVVVVPGGGPFADAVRRECERRPAGESTAHWMAILAMDQHALLLAGLLPTARLVADPQGIRDAVAEGRLPVLSPYSWLRAADPLPHGWQVTSDSIAAWVAARLGARRLVLLKAVEGVPDGTGGVLPAAVLGSAALGTIVDGYFAQAFEPGLECWVVSGRHPERIGELLREARTRGTRILPSR